MNLLHASYTIGHQRNSTAHNDTCKKNVTVAIATYIAHVATTWDLSL